MENFVNKKNQPFKNNKCDMTLKVFAYTVMNNFTQNMKISNDSVID